MDRPWNNPKTIQSENPIRGEKLERNLRRPYMDRLRDFEGRRRTENKSVDKRDKEQERENPGAKMDGPWNNSKRWGGKGDLKNFLQRKRGPKNPGGKIHGRPNKNGP